MSERKEWCDDARTAYIPKGHLLGFREGIGHGETYRIHLSRCAEPHESIEKLVVLTQVDGKWVPCKRTDAFEGWIETALDEGLIGMDEWYGAEPMPIRSTEPVDGGRKG